MLLTITKHISTLLAPLRLVYETARDRLTAAERQCRLGRPPPYPPGTRVLWLHGANLGELTAAYNIIAHLAAVSSPALAPVHALLLTSSTPSAARAMAARLAHHTPHPLLPRVALRAHLLPLDAPAAVAAFLRATPLVAGVVVEADFRPTLLTEAASRGVPLALLDARLGAVAHRVWAAVAPRVAAAVFGSFAVVSAQTAADASRIADFRGGVPVPVATSLKFLCSSPQVGLPAATLREFVAAVGGRPVWVAASTHDPDHVVVLAAHRQLRKRAALENALLIVAPRDPRRGTRIVRAAVDAGFEPSTVLLRSEGCAVVGKATAVYVADTLGELPLLYSAADVAFVGNSFGRGGGGHNFAEAAHYGLCVLHGPHFEAFAPLVETVLAQVHNMTGTGGNLCEYNEDRNQPWPRPCMRAPNAYQLEKLLAAALSDRDALRQQGALFQAAVRKLQALAETQVRQRLEQLMRQSHNVRPQYNT